MPPPPLIPISEEVRGVRLELLVEKMRRGATLLPRQGGGSAGEGRRWLRRRCERAVTVATRA
jgi:hypothetical protein